MSPSARGLTGSKLQRIVEFVSVKAARGIVRSGAVSLPLSGEDLGGSVASVSKVTALLKWSCAASVVSTRWRWCRFFAGRRIWQMLLQMSRPSEKHSADKCQNSSKLCGRCRAVRICKAALRHPWIHSPHCSVDGDLLWSCSKSVKKSAEPRWLLSHLQG